MDKTNIHLELMASEMLARYSAAPVAGMLHGLTRDVEVRIQAAQVVTTSGWKPLYPCMVWGYAMHPSLEAGCGTRAAGAFNPHAGDERDIFP